MFSLSCAAAHVAKTPHSSFQLSRSDFQCHVRDIHLMEIKPLDSGLSPEKWRLDVGRATLGDMHSQQRDNDNKKYTATSL